MDVGRLRQIGGPLVEAAAVTSGIKQFELDDRADADLVAPQGASVRLFDRMPRLGRDGRR